MGDWLAAHAQDLLATVAFVSITVGLWQAWPPLGLIVPGAVVFTCLAYTRLRERGPQG